MMSGLNGMRNRRRGGPPSGPRRGGGRPGPDRSVLQEGIYVNDRFLHAFASCIGCPVQVTVKNGKIYEGILRTTSPKVQVVLERAHAVEESIDGLSGIPSRDQIVNTLIFEKNDIVMMTVMEVNLDFAVIDGYTDGAISKCNGIIREKELQPWEGDSSGDVDGLESIEVTAGDGMDDRGWDPNEMFNTNAEKFHIKSDYDPNLSQYTTPLHKSDTQEFRQREARAHQLAMEIERGTDYAKRTALENGDNEEMTFSAVVRPSVSGTSHATPGSGHAVTSASGGSSGKYVVPQLRHSGVAVPAQRPQQHMANSLTIAPISQTDAATVDGDVRSESHVNGMDATSTENRAVYCATPASESHVPSDRDSSVSQAAAKHAGKSGNVIEGLKEFSTKFKLTESSKVTTSSSPSATVAMTVGSSEVPVQSPPVLPNRPPAIVHQTPTHPLLPVHPQQTQLQASVLQTIQLLQPYQQQTQPTVSQQLSAVQQPVPIHSQPVTTHAALLPVHQLMAESPEDKPIVQADGKETLDVAKKSSLNPLAKEFNPTSKPLPPPRALPSTTPPRPLSLPQSPVSAYPTAMPGSQFVCPQPQVLVPMQQQQQQQPQQQQHAGPRYPTQQQKRVTVSARGTGELGQSTQPTVINGPSIMPQPVLQLGQGHMAYPAQQFIPVGTGFPGTQYRLLVQQPLLNMTQSHDPNMPQLIGSSAQPGMYLTPYTPHNGSQPPPMPNHGPSSQQQQNHSGGPTPSASSGHQTPTPSQHTQYMQQVSPLTMMPQSSAMAQQQHVYHMATPLPMQHQVVGQPQGATQQSPQVAFTSGPIPFYQQFGIMAQPPQAAQMGPPLSQSGGMPPPGQHQGHLMLTQQTPQHPSMHGPMSSQMMMQSQPQPGVPNAGVGPGHQYVQTHNMQVAGNMQQVHPSMAAQHVMNAGQMYTMPTHAVQQPGYQHGTQ